MKFDHKRVGQFLVNKVVSSHANQLDLPLTIKIHPVFHLSLMEPASGDPVPGHVMSSTRL